MEKLKRVVSKEDLYPCQVTYSGIDYSPITHKRAIESILEFLYNKNISPTNQIYLSSNNGQRMIGRFTINCGDSECGYEISVKNSLDGSMSFGLASGTHTFICSNGSVYGDISAYKRKHSGNASTEILFQIENAVNMLEETMKLHIQRRNKMKELDISKRTIAELCGRLHLENEIISATQLGIIKKEIENPSFDYKSEGSVWEFYNHCTNATRETTPLNWHKVHKQLGDWFVKNLLEETI